MYQLMMKTGKDKGKSWTVGDRPVVIGRGIECDVKISNSHISRRHCQVRITDGVLQVEDLGSTNACLLNGTPVNSGALEPGDELALGPYVFVVTVHQNSESPPKITGIPEVGTVPISRNAFLAESASPEFLARPRTLVDLYDLFKLSGQLSRAKGAVTLVEVFTKALRIRFEAPSIDLFFLAPGERKPVIIHSSGRSLSRIDHTALDTVCDEQKGLLLCQPEPVGTSWQQMLVPLVTNNQSFGGVVVEAPMEERRFDEKDLELLGAYGQTFAPFLRAAGETDQLKRDFKRVTGEGARRSLLGVSPGIEQARKQIRQAAVATLNVLILGQTGTGKDVAARMIHEESARHEQPYVVVNCAAIPEDLFESEMFGHEKGSFTGAHQRRIGCFEEANGGTLFLDEVGDLAAQSQARLLRAIETGTFRRVGGQADITVDVRIVSATNKLVEQMRGNMTMRDDLYHRLCGFEIHLPPLGDRPEDIPILAEYFLELLLHDAHGPARRFAPKAIARLLAWHWPGNVRELRACIARAVAIADTPEIQPDDILLQPALSTNSGDGPPPTTLADAERQHILRVLRSNRGNIRATARALDISRTTLYKKFEDYGIDP